MVTHPCPHCGAEIPRNARVCPECGSDEKTGWSESAESGGLDLPEENFDYNEFVKDEFGGGSPKPRRLHWFWWLVAIGILAGFAALLIR